MHCLHVREVSVPVPVTAICVISSPLLISANIIKPVLVTATTVSVISDVIMQSLNVTIVAVCRSVCKNQRKTFFLPTSTLLRHTVNVCKLHVHCHDVCNFAPLTCISVNYVEIPLNAIRYNVHKTVVLYKTVQSFCSDAVVQNVNVRSVKIHNRVSPIKCFMLETSSFAVTPSTKLPSSSTLSPPSSSLSSSSSFSTSPSSSLSSSPLSLNPPSSSSSSVSLYISSTSEVYVSPSYLNSSVFFLTTCFLLFIGFRCNILSTNIYIDLFLLALVFSKNFSTFNKRYSKFTMCYNFNCRMVLDFYILFQSFF